MLFFFVSKGGGRPHVPFVELFFRQMRHRRVLELFFDRNHSLLEIMQAFDRRIERGWQIAFPSGSTGAVWSLEFFLTPASAARHVFIGNNASVLVRHSLLPESCLYGCQSAKLQPGNTVHLLAKIVNTPHIDSYTDLAI